MSYVNFPNLDWDCHSAMDLDGAESVKSDPQRFLKHYVYGPIREGQHWTSYWGSEAGEMTEILVGEHF